MIYFDNSATTPIFPEALDTYMKVSQAVIGNPSSLHKLGVTADQLLQQSRKQVADLLNVSPKEIYFTSGGTEGDNWAIKGTAIEKVTFGKHLITSSVEHPAVSKTMQQLEKLGFEVRFRPAYFPYTYLSTETEIYLEEKESWIELGGAGMFRPEVLKPLGIDKPALAFGMGIERLAMIRYDVEDIRMLYKSDIKWLREVPLDKGVRL